MSIYRLNQKVAGGGVDGGGGTSDYNDLTNKPTVNSVTLTGNKTSADLGLQPTIDSSNKLSADLVDDTSTTNKFVTASDKTTWNSKQNALTFDSEPTSGSTNPVTSGGVFLSLVEKADISSVPSALSQLSTDTSHRTVTDTEKATWNGKQNAISSSNKISADNVDDTSAINKFVTSAEKSTWNSKVSDVTLNGTTVVSNNVAVLTTVDNVTSTSLSPLSANQGKLLNDRINNLSSIGRFLSLWNCATGLATTEPTSYPYTYHTGDYFIITIVGATNYMPNGNQYTGTASTTVTTEDVQTGDIWRYDGTQWSFESNHASSSGVSDVTIGGATIVSAGVAVIPTASSSVTGALSSSDWSTFNAKQNALTFDSAPTASSSNPVTSVGIRTAIDNKVRSGTSAPSGTANIGDIYIQYSA